MIDQQVALLMKIKIRDPKNSSPKSHTFDENENKESKDQSSNYRTFGKYNISLLNLKIS